MDDIIQRVSLVLLYILDDSFYYAEEGSENEHIAETVSEQVGICLYIMVKGASYRDAKDRFKHSISTILHYFRLVLDALVTLSHDIIRPNRDLKKVPPEVQNSSLY